MGRERRPECKILVTGFKMRNLHEKGEGEPLSTNGYARQLAMQFIDLKAQYGRHKSEIDARIQTVLDHGGKLWADPDQKEGACFLIQLPFSATVADDPADVSVSG